MTEKKQEQYKRIESQEDIDGFTNLFESVRFNGVYDNLLSFTFRCGDAIVDYFFSEEDLSDFLRIHKGYAGMLIWQVKNNSVYDGRLIAHREIFDFKDKQLKEVGL